MKTIEKDFKGTEGEFEPGTFMGISYGVKIKGDTYGVCEVTISGNPEIDQANARLFAASKRMAEQLEESYKDLKAMYNAALTLDSIGIANLCKTRMKEIETLMEEIL